MVQSPVMRVQEWALRRMWHQHERGPRAQPFFEKAEASAAEKPFLNDADMLT